jgi:ribulose-5-phosphate 4-epimerase/fuculose-1-phosphate aldolase
MQIGRRALILGAAAVVGRAALSVAQSRSEPLPTVVADLVTANRILAMEGILDGLGHVSVRNPGDPSRFLLARSIAPELVTAGDILEYNANGEPLDARGRDSYRERFIHSEIYRLRPDVQAIVHCHTPSLIPFAASDVPMRAMYHMAAFVADGVPVFDIRKAAGVTDLLVKDAPLGRALAKTLGTKAAVLMRGHGAVIVATSIPNVVGRSVYLDLNARAQLQAIQIGGKLTYVEADEAKLRMSDPNEYSRAWDLWKKKAAVNSPFQNSNSQQP